MNMKMRTVVFLLVFLVSNFSYALDSLVSFDTDFVKKFIKSGEEDSLHELMKPGVELQVSEFTGLQPTDIKIMPISALDFEGLTNIGIQKFVGHVDTAPRQWFCFYKKS